MIRNGAPGGRVFSGIISDTNTPSRGLVKKQIKMREGQRSGLFKVFDKTYVRKIIRGGE